MHAATSRVENSVEGGLSCQLNTQAYFLIVNAEVKLLHNIDTDVSTERDHRLSRRRRRRQREHGGTHQGSRRNILCVSFCFFLSLNLLRPEPGQVGQKARAQTCRNLLSWAGLIPSPDKGRKPGRML